ncbi:MAG: disulfide bond formation protein B [Limnobacter sp.]|nr:disulfide bond formation protein B [Limnobacter sp.]
MHSPIRVQSVGVGVLVLSVFCLSMALYLQVSKDWFPCALCVVKRYFYWFTGLAGLGVWVLPAGRQVALTRVMLVLGALLAFSGVGIALYHVWVVSNPGQTCGVDPLQVWLNDLPWASAWWLMFEADGLCSDAYPPLLGLSLPAWSALGFLSQGLLFCFAWPASRAKRFLES